ncbi:hypothetical protein WJX84_005406 [Apatococcus fuscideae]|uniref:VLRF1 domain-containing protein n=1 Tax=Apatococcus fuscideae TaxID=2026836 RepID=A0AAW1T335_9CHLO
MQSNPLPVARQGVDQGSALPQEGFHGSMQQHSFDWSATETVIRHCIGECQDNKWTTTRGGFMAAGPSGKATCQIDLPSMMAVENGEYQHPNDYLFSMPNAVTSQHFIALLAADAAALGVWRNGDLLRHRVLTGYTVRKQQGKAQMAYQRQGGGGRSVGARIRKRETRRLFQAVSDTFVEWQEDITPCRNLYYAGVTRVWNEVWDSKRPAATLTRDDPRWIKVPKSIRRPRFKVLEHIAFELSHGRVITAL